MTNRARHKTQENHYVTKQRMRLSRPGRAAFLAVPVLLASTTASAQTLTMQQLLSNNIEQRFGMFIHYNMNTYYYGWGEKRVDPKTFAPPAGDCHTFTDQWAKAAKSAGMKFGILTTKHHDGFAIWPSKATPPSTSPSAVPYTIAQSSVPTMDVVKCYVDSFRAQGLDPNLYFSIWDPNNGIGSVAGHNTDPGAVDWNVVGSYITTQITELLTNYGNIPVFVFDGYAWLTGHQMIPYQKIRALVRQLQPNTIIVDHNGGVPWEVDVEYFEEPLGVTVPSGNVIAGAQGQTIAKDKNWFWRSTQAAAGYLSASSIANEIKGTESNYTNFILDCPPNLQGLLEDPVVTAPLPQQLPKIETPLTPVSATATSGDASLAIDGYNDSIKGVNNTMHSNKGESLWTSTGALPQSITLNLGKSYDNIDMLEYLPQRHTGTTAGNITSYKVLVSTDNVTFTQVASGTWPADPTYHGLLCPQRVQFPTQSAQYVRLEADAVSGGGTSAIAGEIAVGSSGATGAAGSGGAGGSDGTGGNSGTGGSGGGAGAGGSGSSSGGAAGRGGSGGGAGGSATGGAGGHGGTVASTTSAGGAGAAGGAGGSATSTSGLGGSAAGGAASSSSRSATLDAGTGTGGSTGTGGATANASATPDAATSIGGTLASTETGTGGAAGSSSTSAATGGSTSAAGGTTGILAAPDAEAAPPTPASSSGCSCALNGRSSSAPLSAWLLFGLAALILRTHRGRQTRR
jgi:alpha-L-fucosidase